MLETLTDSLILKILSFCDPLDVAHVGQLSISLREICHDQLLWRGIFHRYFQLPNFHQDTIGNTSWRSEFIRLVDEVPIVQSEMLTRHTDQVLHVSFAHNGKMFATTGKDAYIHLWKSTYPTELQYSYDMSRFSWKYSQFSQFNESDTLLLVSGVQFGNHNTSGEIAIFGFDNGFQLRCRTPNKPYDVFGSWYSDKHFFSGELHWLDHLISKSDIWLNLASQETDSEHKAIMNHIFKFYNPKASSVRSLVVANMSSLQFIAETDCSGGDAAKSQKPSASSSQAWKNRLSVGNPPSSILQLLTSQAVAEGVDIDPGRNVSNINYSDEYHKTRKEQRKRRSRSKENDVMPSFCSNSFNVPEREVLGAEDSISDESEDACDDMDDCTSQNDFQAQASATAPDDELMDPREKMLIFTCGSMTYTPHQIGFKRIKPFPFKGRIQLGMTLAQAIMEKKRREQQQDDPGRRPVDYSDQEAVAHLFDAPDSIINLYGHIIGMTLSPDHRYLYVNCRPWPFGCEISDPLEPPPIAQEIDIHVIDLVTLKEVGIMRRAHRAYTPNDECFFIFLDACEDYLASGSEDRAGYVWDRAYGVPLVRLPHQDVVNSVAFNPKNPEMLITVSDDYTVKVWRSKRLCRELGIISNALPQGTKLYHNKPQRQAAFP